MRNTVAKKINKLAIALKIKTKSLKRAWKKQPEPKNIDTFLAKIETAVHNAVEKLKASKATSDPSPADTP